MKIRTMLLAFFAVGLALSTSTLVLSFWLEGELLGVEEAQLRRHHSYLLADELRQSSDDLTRFARTYVVTGDTRFKRYFEEVLAIRDGTLPRPDGYEGIYWDLVVDRDIPEPTGDSPPRGSASPTATGDRPSLEGRMLEANFSVEEFSKLKKAQNLSDELVGLENVAMNAVAGRYDDGTGAFAEEGSPNPQLAAELLHGDRYHAAKARIMEPIGEFLSMVDHRTSETLRSVNRTSYGLLVGILATTGTLVFSLGLMLVLLQRRLLQRTAALCETAEQIMEGQLETRSHIRGPDEIGQLGEAFDSMVERLAHAIDEAEARTAESELQRSELEEERNRSETLLHNILPAVIAGRLKQGESTIAETYPEVTVLFADIVGFTKLSEKLGPKQIVSMLNDVFQRFDKIAMEVEVEKIKTIGDCYMVVGGVPDRRSTHCQQIAEFAINALESFNEYAREFVEPLQIRVGIHTGTVVAGVVGTQKFSFDLWGDVVNIASRLESTGSPNRIHVSDAVQVRLHDDYDFEERGDVEIKGKGSIHTWFLEGRKHGAN